MRTQFALPVVSTCILLGGLFAHPAEAKTLCVNPGGSSGCHQTIQSAVSAASNNDVIHVWPGVYKEAVVVGKPLSLLGTGAEKSIIDASNLPNGILLDGLNNPGLHDVTVAGFTVKNALYEGVLVLNMSDAVIRNNHVLNNDNEGPVFGSGPACNGQPAYETDESGDCGGGVHLIGAVNSIISDNFIIGKWRWRSDQRRNGRKSPQSSDSQHHHG